MRVSDENAVYKEIMAVTIVQFVRTLTGQDLTVHSYPLLLLLSIIAYIVSREHIINNKLSESVSVNDNKANEDCLVESPTAILSKSTEILRKKK